MKCLSSSVCGLDELDCAFPVLLSHKPGELIATAPFALGVDVVMLCST